MPAHDWIPSTLGHGEVMCRNCKITNREAAVLGLLNECDSTEHRLIGNSLVIESDPETGETLGVIGRCTCGWDTGYRFTSFTATVAFNEHYHQATGRERP